MLLGTAWIGDDAFITLRVIDNFVNGYGLRYNVIERVQVFTHPLWFMLLTPFYALTREPMVTTMLVSVLVSLGALWLLAARIAKDVEYGCLLVLLAMASTAIYQYSTSGLETPLTFLLLAMLVWQLQQHQRVWIPAGIIGLLLLNRLDLAVLVGPLAAYLFVSARGQRIKVAMAVTFPTLAWMVFSLVYYGALFPNTAYAKLGTGFGAGELASQGLVYAWDFVQHDPLLALVIGTVVIVAARSADWKSRLLGLGIVLYIIYTIIIGGDFMRGRFFTPPGFLAFCLLARFPMPVWLEKKKMIIGLIGIVAVAVLLVARVMENQSTEIPANGITDERQFFYADNGLLPVLAAWSTTGEEPVHPWAKLESERAKAHGNGEMQYYSVLTAGMHGYYAGPTAYLLDSYALTNAFLARLPAVPGGRVGHNLRIPPPGYRESIYPYPKTDIESLRPLLNDVTLATRAPFFARGRWSAIWRLSFGYYNWIYRENYQQFTIRRNTLHPATQSRQ